MIIATLLDLLVDTPLVTSRREARQLITAGGCYLNDERVTDPARRLYASDLLHQRYLVLRKGKRQAHVIDCGLPLSPAETAALLAG